MRGNDNGTLLYIVATIILTICSIWWTGSFLVGLTTLGGFILLAAIIVTIWEMRND